MASEKRSPPERRLSLPTIFGEALIALLVRPVLQAIIGRPRYSSVCVGDFRLPYLSRLLHDPDYLLLCALLGEAVNRRLRSLSIQRTGAVIEICGVPGDDAEPVVRFSPFHPACFDTVAERFDDLASASGRPNHIRIRTHEGDLFARVLRACEQIEIVLCDGFIESGRG